MKSRSHRLPVANPQDDWIDGSWTVDCVCGVNFDDGEEMVNCDECSVWVHTRCVRYVKSEKLFACDKCKNKATTNDSEETEVAQLLVELPTKTLTMNSPYPNTFPIRNPFRLWTDLPMEERVHVQGVPGGDPALFSGLSSVFGRQLWKCSGYVPKIFNFKYSEFPCWDNETREAHDNTSDRGNEMIAGNVAGALFSLSKENCLFAPVSEKPVLESNNAMDSDATTRLTSDVKKDTGLLGPSVIQGNKSMKEEFGMSKDQSGKNKSKIVEKEGYLKKDAHASRPDRGPMAVKTDNRRTKFGNSREILAAIDILEGPRVLDHDTTSYSDIPTSNERFSKFASYDVAKRCSKSEAHPREDKIRNHISARVEGSPMENDGAATTLERSDSASLPVTEEHWPNLRKHNGERYAYSSHSQAVLDCLRNRSEWSRLVDRGPKTSTSRKRRKLDVDSQFTESEDNEDCMDRAAKDVRNKTFESKQEEFPKGKRKARKRRRLALQGRGIKDVRRRHRAEVFSDEEIGSSSESGGDSMFSEDEVQGGETSPAGNEASASSDERAMMS